MNNLGIGGHSQPGRGLTDDWLTPPPLIKALGPFDLDPCASVGQPWTTATQQFTIEDDGLSRPWDGFVWLNPPYGRSTWPWVERLAEHGNGIALVFARTETHGFVKHIWGDADALLFLAGRLHFHHSATGERAKGNSGAPSVLVGYGDLATSRLAAARLDGALVTRWTGSRRHGSSSASSETSNSQHNGSACSY